MSKKDGTDRLILLDRVNMFSITVMKSLVARRRYSIKLYTGRLRPVVQTLTLKYTSFYRNGTPFTYLEQNCTPFLNLKDKPKRQNFL